MCFVLCVLYHVYSLSMPDLSIYHITWSESDFIVVGRYLIPWIKEKNIRHIYFTHTLLPSLALFSFTLLRRQHLIHNLITTGLWMHYGHRATLRMDFGWMRNEFKTLNVCVFSWAPMEWAQARTKPSSDVKSVKMNEINELASHFSL